MRSRFETARDAGREAAILKTNHTSFETPKSPALVSTKKIPLGKDKFALVDAEDYEFLSQWKWHFHQGYAAHGERIGGRVYTTMMHRVVMMAPECIQVDHANQDKLDNRKGNLRYTDHAGNNKNKGPNSRNTSGFKGVHWHKHHKKWQVAICTSEGRKHLGYFATAEEGALAYNRAAVRYHKEFACLNDIEKRRTV